MTNARARLIEDIYTVTDEWECCPLRMPPFDRFGDWGIGAEEVAVLLTQLREMGYSFEVTEYPECIADVMDMVLGKERAVTVACDCKPFVRLTWWQKLLRFINL